MTTSERPPSGHYLDPIAAAGRVRDAVGRHNEGGAAYPVGLYDARAILEELDRLRSENELMRDAEYRRSDRYRRLGDDLARAAFAHLDYVPGPVTDHASAERLDRAAQSWRQADA